MLKTTTKYTFSSIIQPLNYSKTYYKYNGTSLNRKRYPKKQNSSADDLRRTTQEKETSHFDTQIGLDFPRVKVLKADGVGRRFIPPTYQAKPFHEIPTEITKVIVDTVTGETIPFSPLTVLTKNQVVYDYKEQTQEDIQTGVSGGLRESTSQGITSDLGITKTYSMSSRTRSKIKQKLYAWTYAQKLGKRGQKGLTFVTLTFVNTLEDRTAVKCLNNFLTWVRKNKRGFNYLWVAERQKNGRIHFHIICNKFLPVNYYNSYWVRCQSAVGIEHDKHDTSLNPFDIRHIKQLRTLSKYITKYVTKNTTSFDCAVWNCSRTISALSTGYTSDDTFYNYISTDMPTYNGSNGVYASLGEVQRVDYATVIPIYNKKICESYKDVHAFNSKVLGTTDLSTLSELAHTLYNRPVRAVDFSINHEQIAHKLFEDLPRN